ncbi:Uncharacterised protein [Cedecea neteri]|uniref:Uncharacterized protein n=1 Tax=Cedecea neteri TaxID=158822 RepID=A0A2X3J880_9ENTR|nr:Uncharacterised protein [Cedecea neteri]
MYLCPYWPCTVKKFRCLMWLTRRVPGRKIHLRNDESQSGRFILLQLR